MIYDTDKETIIKYLGKQPSRKIRPYLKKKKIFNNKGSEHSPKSIQNIINGEYENIEVETAIFELVATSKKEQQKLNRIKQNLN